MQKIIEVIKEYENFYGSGIDFITENTLFDLFDSYIFAITLDGNLILML